MDKAFAIFSFVTPGASPRKTFIRDAKGPTAASDILRISCICRNSAWVTPTVNKRQAGPNSALALGREPGSLGLSKHVPTEQSYHAWTERHRGHATGHGTRLQSARRIFEAETNCAVALRICRMTSDFSGGPPSSQRNGEHDPPGLATELCPGGQQGPASLSEAQLGFASIRRDHRWRAKH